MPLNELEDMTLKKDVHFYKKKQPIFVEGSHPMGIYCISRGKVKVHKIGDEGRSQIIRFAKEGDVLGYRELVSNNTYTVSATTLEETVICFIPRNLILKILKENHETAMNILKLMAAELQDVEDKLTSSTQKTVRERLAENLVLLEDIFGLEEDKTLKISLSRREISNIVGTSTETVIRFLSDFHKAGYIDFTGKKIKLLDIPGLCKVANLNL